LRKSKVILGVTQFGLNYGILNQHNSNKKKKLRQILNFSKKKGINSIYSSKYYGNANKFLATENLNYFKLYIKFKSQDLLKKNFLEDFEKMKKKLKKNNLILMLDRFENLKKRERLKIYNILLDLKKDKKINKFGYSIYSFKNLKKICHEFKPNILQCPYNVIDRRLEEKKLLQFLKINKIEIHVRSIFLQGLLILHYSKHPRKFLNWKKIFKKFDDQIQHYKISNLDWCLNFIEKNKYINKILLGVDNIDQLREICSFKNNGKIKFPKMYVKDEKLINPSKW
tara:strand:+ start:528 stop:1376 length:849 start_codon:yes stop_codon:yes gene_type:complete